MEVNSVFFSVARITQTPVSQGLICTKTVHLGLSKVAFMAHVRGGLYEGFHCTTLNS